MKKNLVSLVLSMTFCYPVTSAPLFHVTPSNTNLLISTVIPNHMYPTAGIKLTSHGYEIISGCTMQNNGYCVFPVSDTSPAQIAINGSSDTLSAILCLNALQPLSCQYFPNLQFQPLLTPAVIYIANNGASGSLNDPTISVCNIDQTTNLITSCQNAGGGGPLAGIFAQSIVVNSTGTQAFINSQDSGNSNIYQCGIDSNTKTFTSCSTVPITTPSNYYSNYGFLTLNPDNTLAYIIDGNNNRVLACPITSGILQGSCTDTGTTNIDDSAVGIVTNKAGTTAYIGNYDGWVTVCSVDGSTFSNCVQHTGGGSISFHRPSGLAFNQSETILYVTDYGTNSVYGCTPSFSSCFTAATISSAYGIKLNQANTFAYITNFSDTSTCQINQDGTFANCTSTTGFNTPIGVELGY